MQVQRWSREADGRVGLDHPFGCLGSLPLKVRFLHGCSLSLLLFKSCEPLSSFSGKDDSLDLYTQHHNRSWDQSHILERNQQSP